jgi:hypothetical protein
MTNNSPNLDSSVMMSSTMASANTRASDRRSGWQREEQQWMVGRELVGPTTKLDLLGVRVL